MNKDPYVIRNVRLSPRHRHSLLDPGGRMQRIKELLLALLAIALLGGMMVQHDHWVKNQKSEANLLVGF